MRFTSLTTGSIFATALLIGGMAFTSVASAAGPTNPVGTTNTLPRAQPTLGESGAAPRANELHSAEQNQSAQNTRQAASQNQGDKVARNVTEQTTSHGTRPDRHKREL
ncbi:hypothetical protein HKX42_09045 [Salinisphaera sp. USBA-960]|nr:hypothetical protein [Salifodinibacter halophilus]NNC27020.1 hypothetical protein [Salifodinibacter halophilus]